MTVTTPKKLPADHPYAKYKYRPPEPGTEAARVVAMRSFKKKEPNSHNEVYPPECRLTVARPDRTCLDCDSFTKRGGSCPGTPGRFLETE
jgi:hypothetical protein